MASIEPGNVCVKITGREAGQYCVVLKKVNNSFVLVTGPKQLTGIKRRQCNIAHLEPTQHRIDVSSDTTDEDVVAAYEKANLVTKLKLKKPSAGEMKGRKSEGKSKAEEKPKKAKSE
ncbi:MAG: 50S ribosomal protein L14e [Candidatus Aenigmarchaeota archaeon]|nr:50S ribosomal protein L14e [Candidatus Aenigmarchaeota archaeon]